MTTMIALHGFGSTADSSSTIRTIKELFSESVNLITPTYDAFDPNATSKQLLNIANAVAHDEEMIIFGISLGGFWARWLANNVKGAKLILVNPSINAPVNLKKYTNEHGITNDILAIYSDFYIKNDKAEIPTLVLVSMDDVVVPPQDTLDTYSGSAVIIESSGGHRFPHLPQYHNNITTFINTIFD